MRCRICLEGPDGLSNPLRLRCLCLDGAVHDACITRWICEKYKKRDDPRNIIYPECEVCKSKYKGIILKTKLFNIKPAYIIAQSIGFLHFAFVAFTFRYIHFYVMGDSTFAISYQQKKENHILLSKIISKNYYFLLCNYFIFLHNLFFRYIHYFVAYKWALLQYKRQLKSLPLHWAIQMKARQIVLSPNPPKGIKVPDGLDFKTRQKNVYNMIKQVSTIIWNHLCTIQNDNPNRMEI